MFIVSHEGPKLLLWVAGFRNSADNNSFFGNCSGFANTTGYDNAFFGAKEASTSNPPFDSNALR